MMQFGKTWEKVLSGEKVATSRIVKPQKGNSLPYEVSRSHRNGTIYLVGDVVHQGAEWDDIRIRPRYAVGQDYAVQPGRGQKSVGRIRITGIERYDVRSITGVRANMEGFKGVFAFLDVWTAMHDPTFNARWAGELRYDSSRTVAMLDALANRQAAKYDAWFIRFELMKGGE